MRRNGKKVSFSIIPCLKATQGSGFIYCLLLEVHFFFFKLRSVKKSILDKTIEAARDEEDMTALGSFMTPQGAGSPQK